MQGQKKELSPKRQTGLFLQSSPQPAHPSLRSGGWSSLTQLWPPGRLRLTGCVPSPQLQRMGPGPTGAGPGGTADPRLTVGPCPLPPGRPCPPSYGHNLPVHGGAPPQEHASSSGYCSHGCPVTARLSAARAGQ